MPQPQWQARFEIGNQNVDQILFVLMELAEVILVERNRETARRI
jgi:hypothetical protein